MKNNFLSHAWMVLAGLFFSAIFGLESKASSIARTVTIVDSQTIAITLEATPDSVVSVYAVEESVSSGVTAINISDGGSYDAANSLIKWGPWFDAQTRVLSYELEVSDNITTGTFPGGQGSFDGVNIAINGEVRWDAGETEPTQGSSRVVRSIASAGGSLLVKLEVSPESTVFVHAVEDGLPSGLVPTNINEGGSFDAANGLIKWGPWFDAQTRMLSYELDTTGQASFTLPGGKGSFDGVNVLIEGDLQYPHTPNNPPIAFDAVIKVESGKSSGAVLYGYDPDEDDYQIIIESEPTHGLINLDDLPVVLYTPYANYVGEDSFRFILTDGTDFSESATVSVFVTEPEKPKGIDSITRLPSGKLVIEFTGTLKSTKSLRDPFLPVDGAESPLITPATDAAMFFSAD
jgi:hypothetical protein